MRDAEELFQNIVRPRLGALHATARRYTAREADACDLVQETLLRAWRNFAPTEERGYRASWLFVIMRNIAFEWHRTSQHRVKIAFVADQELTELSAVDLREPLPELVSMSEEQFREFLDDTIAAALDALSPAFREVLILSVAGGLTYREIACVVDCPVGTVMSRAARARREPRERLAGLAAHRRLAREPKA